MKKKAPKSSIPPSVMSSHALLDADRPIKSPESDLFRRADFANVLAQHVARVPDDESLVFSLVGAWGSGKTSVLHMADLRLRALGVTVIWFNPWLFSGPEQIATQFMRELGRQLRSSDSKLGRVGELVEGYGKVLEVGGTILEETLKTLGPLGAALAGAAKGGAASALGAAFKTAQSESVFETRTRVEDALKKAKRRVVVFIDDIDRLDGAEIRLVFKLVRLVADFPNVSYVLSFERQRVERALDAEDVTGRSYLAKIVQSSFDLPPLDPEIIAELVPQEIARCTTDRNHGPFHEDEWPDILVRLILPLIRNPRDVKRYVNAILPALDMVNEEVALEDLLALEAVRVFLPEVYDSLPAYADVLTMNQLGSMQRDDKAETKARVEAFIQLGGVRDSAVVKTMCKLLFPTSRVMIDNHAYPSSSYRNWRRDRRVACAEVLDLYLERAVRRNAAKTSVVRKLAAAFDDAEAVDKLLHSLQPEELESALLRLTDRTDELAAMAFENGFVGLLRHTDKLRHHRKHPFDFGAALHVSHLLLWVLQATSDKSRCTAAVATILRGTSSFTWREQILCNRSDPAFSASRRMDVAIRT